MNADRLLAYYEKIADAPDAIPRLRRFILDLAVRGKLVPQDPNDEPAAELLERITAEKARLVKTGEIKKQSALPPVAPSEEPFSVPNVWEWTRIGSTAYVEMGQSPPSEHYNRAGHGIPFFQGKADFGKRYPTARYWCAQPKKYAAQGDILISVRAPVGPTNLASEPCCIGRGLAALRSHNGIDRYFLLRCLEAFEHELAALGFGTTFVAINKNQLTGFVIPLPPLAEQHRIVAKVDELMALCDRLEEGRTERETTRDRLTTASLARLNEPDPDPAVFQNHAAFALDNLIPLTSRPDQIKALRQTILNLAVRGKLVKQDPNDEPASELLKRIASEKARLVKAEVIRRPKVPVLLSGDELPFHLPRAWAWTQIAELGVISPRNDSRDDHVASFVPMPMIPAEYGATNVHEPRQWGEIKKGYTHFAEGDVGLAKITPCFENGKSIVFRNLTGGTGSGTTELHVVRPIFVDADYIVLFLKTPHFIETGIPRMTGTAGQKRVPAEYFANSPFPLPPLAEQHRIVAKVDELMVLCERLEASLATSDNTRRLLDALLHEALAPRTEIIQQDIPVIAQNVSDKPPGPPKVLTESTPIRT